MASRRSHRSQKGTVAFRLDSRKRKQLDYIAAQTDRDRSWVINEAIDAYLDARSWQVERIERGLREAEAGRFATESEVKSAFAKWRRLRAA